MRKKWSTGCSFSLQDKKYIPKHGSKSEKGYEQEGGVQRPTTKRFPVAGPEKAKE